MASFYSMYLVLGQKKNICSNVTGFPSSIAYCILTSLIIHKFPTCRTVFDLVFHFFNYLSKWNGYDPFVLIDPSFFPVRNHKDDPFKIPSSPLHSNHQEEKKKISKTKSISSDFTSTSANESLFTPITQSSSTFYQYMSKRYIWDKSSVSNTNVSCIFTI